MGWAVATEDVTAVAARLGTELVEIRRQGFVGRLTGVAEAMAEPGLPFFVERGRDVPDPGAGGDAGGHHRGSRWPATRRASTPGWAAPSCPSACGRARPRCSRWGSESSGYRDRAMTSDTIQTSRLRTHYVESGPEDGIPVVLLHGNLSTGRFYEHLFDGAPERYRLIAPTCAASATPSRSRSTPPAAWPTGPTTPRR